MTLFFLKKFKKFWLILKLSDFGGLHSEIVDSFSTRSQAQKKLNKYKMITKYSLTEKELKVMLEKVGRPR